MSQAKSEKVGSDQPKVEQECPDCGTQCRKRARTFANYRPWTCPNEECEHA